MFLIECLEKRHPFHDLPVKEWSISPKMAEVEAICIVNDGGEGGQGVKPARNSLGSARSEYHLQISESYVDSVEEKQTSAEGH